ncbi:MAG: hypothetical protein ACI4J4_06885 [Ruminiclostridium sp.]
MKNLIKAQLFQLKKDRLVQLVFAGMLIILMLTVYMNQLFSEIESSGSNTLNGGSFFANSLGGVIMVGLMFVIIAVPRICGWDFTDKTTNYELMSGHIRSEVFFSRIIVSLLAGVIGWIILFCAPIVVTSIINGWGEKLPLSEAVLRGVLMLFPIIRLVCELSCLTFIFKNPYITMGIGYLLLMLQVSPVFPIKNSFLLGMSNLTILGNVEIWTTYGLDGELNYIFEAYLGAGDIAGTILASLAASLLSLFIGYIFFKNDDIN